MDDLISRQLAIDRLTEYGNGRAVFISVGEAIIRIEQLPPAQLGTNLAEVGTDCISRQVAIETVMECYDNAELFEVYEEKLRDLPPAQPEIIRCRECKFASGDSRICMKFGHSPIGELDFCAWAERRTDE